MVYIILYYIIHYPIHYFTMFFEELNKIQQVNYYIRFRSEGPSKASQLVELFAPNGILTDSEGKTHQGCNNLLSYFQQEQPKPTSSQDPEMLDDGRVVVKFTVYKFFMTWKIHAYFEFDNKNLLKSVVVERQ